jgi:hypothetical protein
MSEERMTVRGKQVRYIHEDDYRAPVDRAGQNPDFEGEADEAAWWNEHRLSEEFWRNAEPAPEDELPPVREPHKPVAQEQDLALVSASASGAALVAGLVLYVLFRLLAG